MHYTRARFSSFLKNLSWCLPAMALIAAPVAADPGNAVARPFHAEMDGAANITGALNPCTFINEPTAHGEATHMGQVVFESFEIINACPPGPTTVDSSFIIEAANGDIITGILVDVVVTVNPDGSALAVGPYFITGGTGRFDGASGEGTWVVEFTQGLGFNAPAHVIAHGTIVY